MIGLNCFRSREAVIKFIKTRSYFNYKFDDVDWHPYTVDYLLSNEDFINIHTYEKTINELCNNNKYVSTHDHVNAHLSRIGTQKFADLALPVIETRDHLDPNQISDLNQINLKYTFIDDFNILCNRLSKEKYFQNRNYLSLNISNVTGCRTCRETWPLCALSNECAYDQRSLHTLSTANVPFNQLQFSSFSPSPNIQKKSNALAFNTPVGSPDHIHTNLSKHASTNECQQQIDRTTNRSHFKSKWSQTKPHLNGNVSLPQGGIERQVSLALPFGPSKHARLGSNDIENNDIYMCEFDDFFVFCYKNELSISNGIVQENKLRTSDKVKSFIPIIDIINIQFFLLLTGCRRCLLSEQWINDNYERNTYIKFDQYKIDKYVDMLTETVKYIVN